MSQIATAQKITEAIDKIKNCCRNNFKQYKPYIHHIRFPSYKQIIPETKLSFDFPLTVLVGGNGTNKTSVLQAIYGCSEGYTTADYWFSTDMDTIDSSITNCYIYGYEHANADEIVEAIKTRIDSKNQTDDYWEPSRPIKKYKMEFDLEKSIKYKNKSTTRWDLMKKNVVYMDCKEYMSAYDLFFYHSLFKKTKTLRTKQERIRSRATFLYNAIKKNKIEYIYYRKNRVKSHKTISNEACQIISKIMGKKYDEIKITNHSFYTAQDAKTIFIKENKHEYSEAFAGSGEGRLILLIDQILHAKDKSLILIDEPEISLHPGAQERFKLFLLNEIITKKHQIILSTHSPNMVRLLPPSAIKVFQIIQQSASNQVLITPNVSWQEAFKEIGHAIDGKTNIYCEDKLAEYILNHFITEKRDSLADSIVITSLPGGAATIISQHIKVAAKEKRSDSFYFLDGDQNRYPFELEKDSKLPEKKDNLKDFVTKNTEKISKKNISELYYNHLDEFILAITGCKIKFPSDGGKTGADEDQLIEMKLDFINYWEEHVFFLSEKTPEIALIKEMKKDAWQSFLPSEMNKLTAEEAKQIFCNIAEKEFGRKKPTSEDIFSVQQQAIAPLDIKSNLFQEIDAFFDSILQKKQ